MVFINRILMYAKKWKPTRKYLRNQFIDSVKVQAIGGSGGNGLPQFGGIGGQGGCVYCVGKEGIQLSYLTRKYPGKRLVAKHGEDSLKKKLIGGPGEDTVVDVPIGISVIAGDRLLGEINEEGDTCILARGGVGGNPNNNFLGYEGQNYEIVLDLKLIADVGFVGFPNAGKSTLLKALSRAKPKIASYPFTTIRPNLGVIEFKDYRKISLADLPGLIEGAHINIGMGHTFLKHVERTKLLLLIADIQGFTLSHKHPHRTCLETVMLLNKELELYDPELLNKPAMLLINKMDTENAHKKYDEIRDQLKNIKEILPTIAEEIRPSQLLNFDSIMGISALNGENISDVKETIRIVLDQNAVVSDHDDVISDIGEKIRERGPKLT